MNVQLAKAKDLEIDIRQGSSEVTVYLSIDDVRAIFQQWDIQGDTGLLLPGQVALLTELIVMKQLQFNKAHNLQNTENISGSVGVVGSCVTGKPKHVLLGTGYYNPVSDDIGFRAHDGIMRVVLSMQDGSISIK